MAKYSNVRANELLNAINTSLGDINKHNLSNVKSSLGNKMILDSGVSPRVSKAISSITSNGSLNGNLVNLKNKLTNLKNAVNIIIKYQKLEREIQELKRRLSTASKYAINSIRRQIASKERTLALYESQIDRFLSR